MIADDLAAKSRIEKITAADIEAAGGEWRDHAWRFTDGSAGCFSKHAIVLGAAGVSQFSHYAFMVEAPTERAVAA